MIDNWGRTDIILTTDQEPATELLAKEAQHQRENRTIARASPRYSPQSNEPSSGRAPSLRARRERAFWINAEATWSTQIPVARAALNWVARHAAWAIARFLVKSDGTSARKRFYVREREPGRRPAVV